LEDNPKFIRSQTRRIFYPASGVYSKMRTTPAVIIMKNTGVYIIPAKVPISTGGQDLEDAGNERMT